MGKPISERSTIDFKPKPKGCHHGLGKVPKVTGSFKSVFR